MKCNPIFGAILGACVLLSTGCACRQGITSADKPGLGSGQRVLVIDGTTFTPGKNVALTIHHFPNQANDLIRGATADANGAFQYEEVFALVDKNHADPNVDNHTFHITAKDANGCATFVTVNAKPFFFP